MSETTDTTTNAPDPDDPRKPDAPTDLSKRSWKFILRSTGREFSEDQCTDLAAALTYYAVLSVFPALLVVISLLGVFGQGKSTVDALLKVFSQVGPSSAVDMLRAPLEGLVTAPGAGIALVISILAGLWSASGYVGAFGRAMNRVYEVEEGRPVWKLRPVLLLVTLVLVALTVVAALILVLSGSVASAIGDAIGLGSTALTVWNIAKWPVLLVIVVVIVALLYHATPNVRQPKVKWVSVGAVIAIVTWLLASLAFAFYITTFSSYNKTYGSLAGFIIFLLWLWITNLALLFGAEVDAETERGRQLQAGMPAEKTLQLPARDSRVSEKKARQREETERSGRAIRLDAARDRDDEVDGSE